jgi:DNA polymerase III gamma/tau subunit
LKTLEEPPPATTFILSTTEPHKLLPTVRSRCATYEFTDVDVEILADHYKMVSDAEGLELTAEVVLDVAIKAEGSVRDGLTLLQKYLSGEAVESHASVYFDLVSALYQADVATALALVGDLRAKEDGRVIIQTLEKWFYWCSLENFGMKTPARQHFPGDAPVFDLTHLQSLFNVCLDVERNFSATPNSKSVLEMGIIRLCL